MCPSPPFAVIVRPVFTNREGGASQPREPLLLSRVCVFYFSSIASSSVKHVVYRDSNVGIVVCVSGSRSGFSVMEVCVLKPQSLRIKD